MASSHHHQHHTHQQTHHTHQFNNCNCTSCYPPSPCCNSTSCNPLPPPPAPPLQPSNPSDQLLQALATTLLLQSQPQPQPQPPVPYFYPPGPDHLASNQYQYQYAFQHKTPHHQPPPLKSHEPLASLFHRVAALESSLFSNPKPTCCTNHDPHPKTYSSSIKPLSLKDLAARTIQMHFRLYLVRRSQILRHLKRLAVIRCHVAAIRSALSHRSQIDPKKVSDQAADLLLQLDFIRSADPMIYEGKRAIEKELVRVIEFVDKIFLREQEMCVRGTDGIKEDEEEEEEDSTEEEKKPKKRVSFEESSKRSNARNSERESYKEVFEGRNGESFQIPKEVFELGDELQFDRMEGPFGRNLAKRGGGSSAPLSAQNDLSRSDERGGGSSAPLSAQNDLSRSDERR